MIKNIFFKYKEQILYILFGFATTFVNWIVYVLFLNVFSLAVSNAIAWFVAVAFAFHVNKKYVFRSSYDSLKMTAKELGMFFGARIISGIVDIAGVPLLVYIGLNQFIFGIEGALAKLIVTVVVMVMNYIFSKYVIFHKKES